MSIINFLVVLQNLEPSVRWLSENPNERLSALVDFISLCYISVISKDHLNVMQDPPPKDGILDCIKWVRVVEHEFVLLLTVCNRPSCLRPVLLGSPH